MTTEITTTVPKEITIHGTTLRTEPCIYQVVDRVDLDAPPVYVELGASILPSADIQQCPTLMLYDDYSGVYDTGLYPESPCYRGMPKDEVEEQVAWLTKNIVEPFDAEKGLNPETGKSYLHHQNYEFWDKFIICLDGMTRLDPSYSTRDLLVIYGIIRSGYVAPEDDNIGKSVKLRGAKFTIKDGAKRENRAKTAAIKEYNTTTRFDKLLASNRKGLVAGLKYRKCDVNDNMSDMDLIFYFKEWVKRNPQAHDLFDNIVEMLKDDVGQQTIWIYTALEKLFFAQKLRQVGVEYWYEGESLGIDFRQIAIDLATTSKPDKLKVRKALLEDSGVTKRIAVPVETDSIAKMKTYMQEIGIPMPEGKKDKANLYKQIKKYS